MKRFIDSFRCSAKEFSDLRSVMVTGLLIAVSMAIESMTIPLGFAKINFAFLAIAAIGMLYGPVVSFFAGALCDIVGFAVHPEGGFLPLYVLIAAVQGLIYGMIAYRRLHTGSVSRWIMLCVARVVDVVFINIICNTAANYHYGFLASESSLMVAIYARIGKNLIELPFDLILITLILPAVLKAYEMVFGKHKAAV